ncbi:MAG: type II secretion system protein [Desulfobia sp.]
MNRWEEKISSRFEKGFTLLELLVAVTLLAIICSMIYSALNVSINFSDKATGKLLSLRREYGLMSLIKRQVRNAWFDSRKGRVVISAQANTLKLVTREPLLHPGAGLVLAYYRYEPADDNIYYTERLAYYNTDYHDDYIFPLEDMELLMENSGNLQFNYEIRENKIVISHRGQEYEFITGCPQ